MTTNRQVPSLADVMEPLEPAEGPRPADRRSSLAPVAVTPAEWRPGPQPCRTTTPEPHLAGEFPMTCYACHMVADS